MIGKLANIPDSANNFNVESDAHNKSPLFSSKVKVKVCGAFSEFLKQRRETASERTVSLAPYIIFCSETLK